MHSLHTGTGTRNPVLTCDLEVASFSSGASISSAGCASSAQTAPTQHELPAAANTGYNAEQPSNLHSPQASAAADGPHASPPGSSAGLGSNLLATAVAAALWTMASENFSSKLLTDTLGLLSGKGHARSLAQPPHELCPDASDAIIIVLKSLSSVSAQACPPRARC